MATPTPMPGGEGTLAAVMPRSPSPTPAEAGTSATETPVLIFLYFHKAIRAELEALHGAAVLLATERTGDVAALAERCRFFFNIYKHHCDAEDAVRMLATPCGALFFCVFLVIFPCCFLLGGGLDAWWIWAWMCVGVGGFRRYLGLGLRNCCLRFGCTGWDRD
jgi:hypothetical protein